MEILEETQTEAAPAVTVTVTTNGGAADVNSGNSANNGEPAAEEMPRGKEWVGILAIAGHPTSDRRYLIPGEISQRELPLPIAKSHEKQAETETVGRIESIEYIPAQQFDKGSDWELPQDIRDTAVVIWAEGTFDGSPEAEDAIRAMENGVGVSIDLPMERRALIDEKTLEEVDPRDLADEDLMGMLFGMVPDGYLSGFSGKIAGASLASIAAFEETRISIIHDHALVASAYALGIRSTALTASAAGLAPLAPPKAWFEQPEPNEATPLTIEPDGRVYGHLALWDQCHVHFAFCERPPRSLSNYAFFHVGQIETAEGEMVDVGRITVGKPGNAKGGHASIVLGRQGAMEHYESTGCVAAFVRATDGRHGIWLSGAVRSDVPAERIRDLRANPPSGDWRGYELVGVLSVPIPGFPIPRAEARLVASAAGEGDEVQALIATDYTEPLFDDEAVIMDGDQVVGQMVTGWTFPCAEELSDLEYRKRLAQLGARAANALEMPMYWEEGGSRWDAAFKDYPAAERRSMAKNGQALPDGSFPIKDCADAEDAIRSQGRAARGKRPQVRAHIRKRVAALGCSGDIFDPYK